MNHKYLYFKGKYYDVGTKVLIKTQWSGIQEATFVGWGTWPFRGEKVSDSYYSWETEKYIVKIIEPVEVVLQPTNANDRKRPPSWEIENGWIWYILIMLVGSIFNARWLIWIVATIYFFSWKNGFLNGGKK